MNSTGIRRFAGGLLAVFKRDLVTALSYRTRLATQLASAVFAVVMFHFISRLVRVSTFRTHDEYFAYVLIGLIGIQVLNSSLAVPPGAMRQELVAGTFERLLVSPFGAVAALAATLCFPFVYAVLMAVAMLTFAGLVFGAPVHWATLPLIAPVSLIGTLSFAPFGILLLSAAVIAKQTVSGANLLVAGTSLVAGLYFPVSLLPGWIRWTSQAQPFTPAIDLFRHVTVGTALTQPVWADLARMSGFAVVLLPVSVTALRWALRLTRRRGTALEY